VSGPEFLDTHLPLAWDYQATQLVKIFTETLAAGVENVVWYCYRDSYSPDQTYGEDVFGIQYYNHSRQQWEYKPSGYAFQFLSRALSGGRYDPALVTVTGPLGSPPSLLWAYAFGTARGTTLLVIWSQAVADQATITIEWPDGGASGVAPEFSEFDYFTNTTAVHEATELTVPVGLTPLLIEVDGNAALAAAGLSPQALALQVSFSYSPAAQGRLGWLGVLIAMGFAALVVVLRKPVPLEPRT
jgi:hypothetical protein